MLEIGNRLSLDRRQAGRAEYGPEAPQGAHRARLAGRAHQGRALALLRPRRHHHRPPRRHPVRQAHLAERARPAPPVRLRVALAAKEVEDRMDWTVNVEAAAPAGAAGLAAPDEAALDRLLDALADRAGVVAGGPGRYGARFDVAAATARRATAEALRVFASVAALAGLPDWPVVRQ